MKSEVYKRSDGRWAWRITASNGQIVATDGGQGYENQADAEATLAQFTPLDLEPLEPPLPPQ